MTQDNEGFQADLSGKLVDREGERLPARFQTRPGSETTLFKGDRS